VKCLGDIPGPRSGAASVIVGNRMFMFGGYGGSGRLDDFYEFNFETKVWSKVRYNGPSPGVRENNGVVEYKGCLYLFGGK
jgi:N-acetylneuraminic acid mutarotase